MSFTPHTGCVAACDNCGRPFADSDGNPILFGDEEQARVYIADELSGAVDEDGIATCWLCLDDPKGQRELARNVSEFRALLEGGEQ